jgi:hypothetical protein
MSEQITAILKRKLEELANRSGLNAEINRNALKEELQFYVLNFIYHHPKYNQWIMYGGSALRIIHGLDRMSVDLDFEISNPITKKLLEKLKGEIETYFKTTYQADNDFLIVKITTGRGLILKFNIGQTLNLDQASNQVHVKIDLNHFVAPKTVIERQPINHNQLSFVILTYNMSTLMASKLAAIFLRGARGTGSASYEEKGRDIYDLLWYMGKKIVPDFDYLAAKDIAIKDPETLFAKLTLKMNKVNKKNLKDDLSPLFIDQNFIVNWLNNWLETYLRLLEDYNMRTVKNLDNIEIYQDILSGNFYFILRYKTEENKSIAIVYTLSDYWIEFLTGALGIALDKKLEAKVIFSKNGSSSSPDPQEKLIEYANLFYQKTEKYLKKTKRIILGNSITTKIIRMTATNLNQKEELVLTKSALVACELDDLLK